MHGIAKLTVAAVAVGVSIGVNAGTYNLDFNNGTLDAIDPAYGDNAQADLSYRELLPLATDPAWGNVASGPSTLFHWGTGYGDLEGVAWSGSNPGRGEIRIEAVAPGAHITLNSFDLGGWVADEAASWHVFDGGWNELTSGSGIAPDVGGRLAVLPGVTSTDGVLILQWGDDAWDVGINNVNYTVSAVPVPAALPLLMSAVALSGLVARRRS